MTLQPVRDIGEYKRLKETLRDRFENERTGEEDLFREQTKILQPLINTQQQTVKAIKDSQDVNSTAISNALLPIVRELERRNEQDMLMEQPYYHQQEIPAIDQAQATPEMKEVDLDGNLNETDRENLQDMSFDLPSVVFKNKAIEDTLDQIKTENRSIGQLVGKKTKLNSKELVMYESRKDTLKRYREIIEGLQGANQFFSTPTKYTGKGTKNKVVDTIYYPSIDDLCAKLAQLDAAKRAGNTGLGNTINSILDELLRVKAIDKSMYNNLYKNIFG